MVEIQRLSGMRPSEITSLRPGDVTLRTDGVMVYRPREWKTEHLDADEGIERMVFLGKRAQAVLQPFLDRDPDAYCFQPRESVAWHREQKRSKRKTPVQPSQADRSRPGASRLTDRYDTNGYAQAIARACTKAGVPLWRPNQLRKAASLMIQDQVDLDAARAILGHRSVATTAKHYATRAAMEKAAKAMKRIG
jgi:integrase